MIFEAAGRVGVDPLPLSWRMLDDMDHGGRAERWRHTADICHAIAQANTKQRIPENVFNRYEHEYGEPRKPGRTVKPSELEFIA